jgi:hypothetical protein
MEEASHHNLLYETLRDTESDAARNFCLPRLVLCFLERKKQQVLIMESGVGDRQSGSSQKQLVRSRNNRGQSKIQLMVDAVSPAHQPPELAFCRRFYLEL